MIWFRHYAKVADHDSAASNENCADEHPWREHIAEKKTCKEGVPEERDGTKGCKNDDGKGGDLEDRPKNIREEEYSYIEVARTL